MKKIINAIFNFAIFVFCASSLSSSASFSAPKAIYPSFSPYKNFNSSDSLNSSLEIGSDLDSFEQVDFSKCRDLLTYCDSPILFRPESCSQIESIVNEYDFKVFADTVNAGHNYEGKMVILEKDLELENFKWESVGSYQNPFKGLFEGNHHKIKLGNTNKPLFAHAHDAGIYDIKLMGKQPILIANAYNVTTENCHRILTT